jgi:hypothetical protein
MTRKLRINGHSHLLPYPEEIPAFMKDKGIFWVDKERKYMYFRSLSTQNIPLSFIKAGISSRRNTCLYEGQRYILGG